MKKRSFFMILALAGMLGLAFASPSQAGSMTLVTTTASFSITAPAGTTATGFEFEFTPIDTISDLHIVSSNLAGPPTITEPLPNTILVSFSAASAGNVVFQFRTDADPTSVGANPFFLTGTSDVVKTAQVNVNVSAVSAPEPSSMALLGIGVTGFLAFRRFRKRGSTA